MKKMRLRTSMAIHIAFMAALTVFLVSILSRVFISRQFEEYVRQTQKKQADDIAESISSNYDEKNGGWNIDYVHGMGMYALKDGYIIRLYDGSGGLLWDAENHDMALCHKVMNSITEKMQKNRPELHGDFVTYTYAFKANGKSNGSIEISYYTPYYLDENAFEFIEALGQILIFVGVISLIVAVFLGIIIAKRITTPVADVISMTKEISEGNYGERVNVNLKEREIYELADAVNNMASSLEEQEYLRRQLTDDIAHELRTPVTNISSYIEMMIDDVMEPTPERLKSCYAELLRLSGLIKDLERLQNAESDAITLEKTDIDIYSLAKEIMQGFKIGFEEKKIDVKLYGEETHVFADRKRIGQVIANFLSNAIKYTDENGSISVSVTKNDKQAVFSVKDTGIGIPFSEQNRVFERFYRTDKSRTRKTGGVGIGLSISKAIVKAHNGTIRCESEPGAGSNFIVTLPLR